MSGDVSGDATEGATLGGTVEVLLRTAVRDGDTLHPEGARRVLPRAQADELVAMRAAVYVGDGPDDPATAQAELIEATAAENLRLRGERDEALDRMSAVEADLADARLALADLDAVRGQIAGLEAERDAAQARVTELEAELATARSPGKAKTAPKA